MNISKGSFYLMAILGGIVWGWLSMAVNFASGAFEFELSFAHLLTIFTMGGAIFGVFVAGVLGLIGDKLPFKSQLSRAVLVSTSLWILLSMGGGVLAHMNPERYHNETSQTTQGFFLSITLGCILWQFWKKDKETTEVNNRRK